jgi:hypothetical protein
MRNRKPALAIAAAIVMALTVPASADWLTRLAVTGERLGVSAGRHAGGAVERLAPRVKAAAASARSGSVLGATVSQEGHWTFVNATGETMTAASGEEVLRVLPLMTGGAAKPGLILDAEALFAPPAHHKLLPQGLDLSVATASATYPLVDRGGSRFVRLRPAVLLEANTRPAFDEALIQLARPLGRGDVRVLSLSIDGPQTLRNRVALDDAGKPQVDPIDPYKLPTALAALSGQTAIVIGRSDGALLHFRMPSGAERAVLIADLTSAAARHDVNLVVLQAGAARQPGTRNWFWQRVEVAGLDHARERPTFADFLDAFASGDPAAPVLVSAARQDGLPTRLVLTRNATSGGGIGDFFADLAAEVTGRVVSVRADAWMVSAERQDELARRIVPGVPSAWQWGYLGLLLVGLAGLPTARGWWARIWPPEDRSEYGIATGYHAARAIKFVVFTALFLPVVALPAAVVHTARQIVQLVLLPVRLAGQLVRWMTRKQEAAG